MKEQKILSIDLDIIMHKCIDLYNDDSEGGDDPDWYWEWVENEYGYKALHLYEYDPDAILGIYKLIGLNKDKPLYFIESHEEIVDILSEQEDYKDTKYHMYNLDFHHDLWYEEETLEDFIKHKDVEYSCANWLGYLFFEKKLASLTWLKASNSLMPIPYAGLKMKTLGTKEFFRLENIDFDQVFFCLSPQWVPEEGQIFYKLLKTYYGK